MQFFFFPSPAPPLHPYEIQSLFISQVLNLDVVFVITTLCATNTHHLPYVTGITYNHLTSWAVFILPISTKESQHMTSHSLLVPCANIYGKDTMCSSRSLGQTCDKAVTTALTSCISQACPSIKVMVVILKSKTERGVITIKEYACRSKMKTSYFMFPEKKIHFKELKCFHLSQGDDIPPRNCRLPLKNISARNQYLL